jgi:hypothetical protein
MFVCMLCICVYDMYVMNASTCVIYVCVYVMYVYDIWWCMICMCVYVMYVYVVCCLEEREGKESERERGRYRLIVCRLIANNLFFSSEVPLFIIVQLFFCIFCFKNSLLLCRVGCSDGRLEKQKPHPFN